MEELTEYILSHKPKKQFKPGFLYNNEGDTLLFFAEDFPYYARRIDKIFTMFYRMSDSFLIGFAIKGIKNIN